MNHLARSCSALLLSLGLLAGCGEDKKVSATDEAADAGEVAAKKAALDGKLAAAVKAAGSAQAPAAGKQGDGPPDKGVFGPGAADKILAPGAPAKVELLGDGADPKVQLAYAPEGEQKVTASVTFRNQGRPLAFDYTLNVKIDKPKDKPKDDKKADGPMRVVAAVGAISGPPQMPKDMADQVAKLKGSEIKWQLTPDGLMSDPTYSLAKGADGGLEQLLRQLSEGLTLSTPALPQKPVGAGAYWMVTDRLSSGGIDVVRYRVFRVEKVEKDKATLSMDVRQYAAKSDIDAGEGQKLTVDQFESLGKGKTEWTAQGLLPARADGQVRLGLGGRIQTGQQGMLQTELSIKLAAEAAEKKK
jgi:hypothetical protein